MSEKSWHKVSASQVETFDKCPRKWYYGSILGDREPQKPNQQKGEEIHAELEHYEKTGEVRPSPHLQIVQAALEHLPPWAGHPHWQSFGSQYVGKVGIIVEQEIDMPTYQGGPNFTGYIDLTILLPTAATVHDHKTTSDFRYAKTPDELKHSVQMTSYGQWLTLESDYEEIWLQHLCLRTRGRALAKPVKVQITRAEIAEEWAKTLVKIRRMAEWAKLGPDTADVLPPNTEQCDAYGGCYYRQKCGFLGQCERRCGPMANDGNILAKMLGMAVPVGAAKVAPAAAAVVPGGVPGAAAVPVGVPGLVPGATSAASQVPGGVPGGVPGLVPGLAPAAAAVPGGVTGLAPAATAVPGVVPGAAPAVAVAPAASPAPVPVVGVVVPASSPATSGGLVALLGKVPVAALAVGVPGVVPGEGQILPPDHTSRVSTPEEVGPSPAPALPGAEAAAAPAEAAPKKRRGRPPKDGVGTPAAAAVVPGAAEATTAAPVAEGPAVGVPAVATEVATAGATVVETQDGVLVPAAAAPSPEVIAVAVAVAAAAAPAPVVPVAPAVTADMAQLLKADEAFRCGVEAIFVDCQPQKGWPGAPPVHLDDFLHAVERLAAASAKQPDYALIRYESKGYLRTAMRLLMQAFPKAVIVDSRTAGSAEFMEVVTPYAKIILRGTR